MAVIFATSSIPGSAIPGGYSTYGHVFEFAVLGVLLFSAWHRVSPWTRAAVLSVAVASAYGVADELHQFLTPGRMPDPVDWATDTVAATVAVGLALVVLFVRMDRDEARQ
jgi:VanZ family protein